jgi:3-phenylpropionate/trans-cinnamate dioxygenase ferredoxin component
MTETGRFTRVCGLSELIERAPFAAEVDGTPMVIIKTGGEVFALAEFCTHEEVSLADGEVYDHTVECWLHGSCFSLRTGQPTGPPATTPLATYPVRVDGDDVFVSVPTS